MGHLRVFVGLICAFCASSSFAQAPASEAAPKTSDQPKLAINMAGLWAVEQVVTFSDCSGAAVGDRSALLFIVSHSIAGELEVKAIGTTFYSDYVGNWNEGRVSLTSGAESGKSSIQLTVDPQGKQFNGIRNVSLSTPCSVTRSLEGRKL